MLSTKYDDNINENNLLLDYIDNVAPEYFENKKKIEILDDKYDYSINYID